MKEYFKNKINWKSYNGLLNALTKYEDKGLIVHLIVCIKTIDYDDVFFMPIFCKSKFDFKDGYNNAQYDIKTAYYYEKYGIFYKIGIYIDDDYEYVNSTNEESLIEFFERVSFKFDMVYEHHYDSEIILVDK